MRQTLGCRLRYDNGAHHKARPQKWLSPSGERRMKF